MEGDIRIFALRPSPSGSIDVKIDNGKFDSDCLGSRVMDIDDGLKLNKNQRDFFALYKALYALQAAKFREPVRSISNANFSQLGVRSPTAPRRTPHEQV